jgi:hypothetical protein
MTRSCLTLLCLLATLALTSCEALDCGPGTHQEGDQCVPNLAIDCSGDLVAFQDGRCVPRAAVCGDGTRMDPETGRCVPDGVVAPDDMGAPDDMANPDDMTADLTEDPDPDTTQDATDDLADLEDETPDPPAPTCPQPADGRLCVSGVVLDWSTGAPVQTQEPLALILDDLLARSAQPDKAPFGATALSPGGAFVLPDLPLQDAVGPLQQMILIVATPPQAPPGSFQRTLTGVLATPAAGAQLNNTPAFVVPNALVQRWAELLADQLTGALGQEQGFLLLRVLSADTGRPVPNATVRFINADQDTNYTKLYLSNDLRSFLDQGSTGDSGAVLILGPPGLGNLTATAPGLEFSPIPGGVNNGLAVTSALLGFAL